MNPPWDIDLLRQQFPTLCQQPSLVYLDNAATTQKPNTVLAAMNAFYSRGHASVRGSYTLGRIASSKYEKARERIAIFLNADPEEIVFTTGATAALNMIATSLSPLLSAGDEILISESTHHSAFLPWQLAAKRYDLRLRKITVDDKGSIELKQLQTLLGIKSKVLVIPHVNNITGSIAPLEQIAAIAKNTIIIADGAQAAAHIPLDIKTLGVDFYIFSGHKMFAPLGIGICYGKKHLLEQMTPTLVGGGMAERVSWDNTTYQLSPWKFEAGTPNVAAAVALAAAVEFIEILDRKKIASWEEWLGKEMRNALGEAAIGEGSITSWHIPEIHSLDMAMWLDTCDIAVRSGELCAQPLVRRLGNKHLLRGSLAAYNTLADVQTLTKKVKEGIEVMRIT